MVHTDPSSKGVLLDFLTIEYQKLIKHTVHLFFIQINTSLVTYCFIIVACRHCS